MKKVLITGISGFAGSYLAEYLIKQNTYDVHGTYLHDDALENLAAIADKVTVTKIDLANTDEVFDLIKSKKPDILFHLAALTSPAYSFDKPHETIINNIVVEINLLEALYKNKLQNTRVLITSSAQIYGIVSRDIVSITEETPFKPTSPYAVSKIAQDYLGLQYFLAYKLPIIRVRPFNHFGPRQGTSFFVSAFAKKIADIEKNNEEPVMKVGNLHTKRDLTDVRDMVRAYSLIVEKGKEGEVYNIGSGTSYKIADILNQLLSLSIKKIKVELDSSLYRPSDPLELVCNNQKLKKAIDWKPEIPIEQTLKETLDYWRKII